MKTTQETEIRMPAEWEGSKRILMAFPDSTTDWNYVIEEAERQFELIAKTLTDYGVPVVVICNQTSRARRLLAGCSKKLLEIVNLPINDTWTRDYGPITVIDGRRMKLLDFGFNGWGLKFSADRDNLVNLNLAECGKFPEESYRNHRDFILEGGSLETDGNHTLLTTSRCLCSPNRNGGKSRNQLETILRKLLGMKEILWLDHGFLEGDDTDSHIDTLARFAPNNTILYVGPGNEETAQSQSLRCMREQLNDINHSRGNRYRLIELPMPYPIYSEEGERLPATYANYLAMENIVFYPTYGQNENDALAKMKLAEAFPDHEIVGIDCRVLLLQHGSLHCSTMQLYY